MASQTKIESKRSNKPKGNEKKKPYWPSPRTKVGGEMTKDIVIDLSKSIIKSMIMTESKEPIPVFRGKDQPIRLSCPHPGYTLTDTSEAVKLRNTLSGMFTDKHYGFRISTALNMSSSASSAVNSVIDNGTISSHADFIALSSVFSSFFIRRMFVEWQPVSRYNFPATGVTGTNVSSLPISLTSLNYGQAAYTSLANSADNFHVAFHSTGDPFKYLWTNPEKPGSTVQTAASPQSWCAVANASNYLGTIQIISQSAPPSLPASQVLGTFLVHWDCLFRMRE